jgi:glycosyltransferase involved in cell wall biosynthesis
VLLPYWSHYGSANLLAGAAAAGRPVLASDFHLVGRLTRENLLGWTFRDRDAGDFARALDLLAQTTPAVRAEFAPALAAYAAASTRGVLIRRIQEMFSGSDRAAISNLP